MTKAHLDGNNQNNSLPNLAYCSRLENISHKKLHGTEAMGMSKPQAKLTDTQVLEMLNSSATHADMARKHGVSEHTVRRIRSGNKWKHLAQEGYHA